MNKGGAGEPEAKAAAALRVRAGPTVPSPQGLREEFWNSRIW